MAEAPRIAIVGHTNTGKTSLMRTLMRDAGFGEVSSRPSTTRHVEGARLLADGEVLVELYDTPGLEDPIALLEALDDIRDADGAHPDGVSTVEAFLSSAAAQGRFEQEAKVLRQMMASDAAFYVVDVRDPVLAKHRDELAILARCGIPILPVLNFVRDAAADESGWRDAMARLGLHAVVRFDTVAPERDGERRLYETLGMLIDGHRERFGRLVACRAREAAARRVAALRLVAELVIDVAAARVSVPAGEDSVLQGAVGALHERVRAREQACVDALLALYGFRAGDLDAISLPLLAGRWEDDLFSPETLRSIGGRLGTGAAAGAAAGVGIDLMFGGLTLGAAAALGALAGGGWQAMRAMGGRLIDRMQGHHSLSVDDAILLVLRTRQLQLVQALEARGHAAVAPLALSADVRDAPGEDAAARIVARARAHEAWSRFSSDFAAGEAREAALAELVEVLRRSLPD